MKAARFLLKLIAILLAVGAAVCCVIAYWDKIAGVCSTLKSKLCPCCRDEEFDDYADWED